MTIKLMTADLLVLASQPWALIWTFIAAAALLTVVGLVFLRKGKD